MYFLTFTYFLCVLLVRFYIKYIGQTACSFEHVGYLVYDDRTNIQILKKLSKYNYKKTFVHGYSPLSVSTLVGPLFKMLGALRHYRGRNQVYQILCRLRWGQGARGLGGPKSSVSH